MTNVFERILLSIVYVGLAVCAVGIPFCIIMWVLE